MQLSPGVRDDRRPAADGVDDGAEQLELLVVEDRGRLAGRPADDERFAPLLEQPVREFLRPRQVEAAIRGERRDHRRDESAETWFRPCLRFRPSSASPKASCSAATAAVCSF